MKFWNALWGTLSFVGNLIVSSPSFGDTVVVPNVNATVSGPGAGLSRPFRQNGSRWQQIYGSPEFNLAPGDILSINELRFRIDEQTGFSSFSTVVQGVSIFMSTTSATYATASTTLNNNIGTDLFQSLAPTDLPLSGSRSSSTSFDVVIPLPNAYQYDRRMGNLLVDIRVTGGGEVPFLDQQGTLPNSTFSIFTDIGLSVGTKTTQGLVTQFGFVVVPEPSIVALFVLGSAALSRRIFVSRLFPAIDT